MGKNTSVEILELSVKILKQVYKNALGTKSKNSRNKWKFRNHNKKHKV